MAIGASRWSVVRWGGAQVAHRAAVVPTVALFPLAIGRCAVGRGFPLYGASGGVASGSGLFPAISLRLYSWFSFCDVGYEIGVFLAPASRFRCMIFGQAAKANSSYISGHRQVAEDS